MRVATTVLTALLALGAAGAVRAGEPGAASAAEDEGLVAVKIKGLDHVWARPGANLSAYDKIMIDPVEVSFRKDWKPDIAGGPITAAERQSIKDSLAKIFRQELKKEIEGGGYPVVNTPDSDVLRVRAEIRDLYINAPDVPRAGPHHDPGRQRGRRSEGHCAVGQNFAQTAGRGAHPQAIGRNYGA